MPLRVINKSLESDCGIPAYTSKLAAQKYSRCSAPPIKCKRNPVDILNNREIAITLWLLVFSVYTLSASKMAGVRTSFRSVISAFFAKQIIVVLGLMIVYMAVVIYWLSKADLWNIEQLKNTIFWCASVGFMSLFKLELIKKDKNFFKHSVINNLQLLAIIQFIVGVYTFPLLVEVILVPILVLIGGMLAISETDKKYHQVKTLLEYLLSFFGVILVGYALYMLIANFGEFGKEKNVYDFFVPPLLTLLYLPFILIMMTYSSYEQVFIRIQFSIRNRFLRYLAKLYSSVLFNIRIDILERWSFQLARENVESHSALVDTFKHIFRARRSERNPKKVPFTMGWSPYKAKDFLLGLGVETGYYNSFYEDEWSASSSMIEFGDSVVSDNIAYYVEGTEDFANRLKIKVNVNDAARAEIAQRKLLEFAETLSISSLSRNLSEQMKSAILCGKQYSEKIENRIITLVLEKWPSHRFNGYELNFIISSI